MSTYRLPAVFGSDRVLYECSCGKRRPITRIYFCRHCLKLRCRDCLSHEVDSQYCQHCLEYIPTIDAKLKKNKCSACFSCPCCEHTLGNKADYKRVPSETEPDKMTQKKIFYLYCFYCKWSSRDANIPDQNTGSGGWPEAETPNAKRIDELFDHYRLIAQKEKLDKEKKRINPRAGNALHLLDKYGIAASLSPKVRAQFYAKMPGHNLSSPTGAQPSDLKSPTECESSTASEDLTDYELNTKYYYEDELDLNEVSTVEQRLSQIEFQPELRKNFHPMSHMLSVKRSLRCKECDHNLSKPEYNPSSIKFKILLAAYYHVPEVRLRTLPKLEAGKETTLDITIENPAPYKITLALLNTDDPDDGTNCDISLPQTDIIIPAKDDTLDIDVDVLGDKAKTGSKTKDPSFITFRRSNKVGLTLPVTLRHDTAGAPRVGFYIKHDFLNTVVGISQSGEKREPQIRYVTHKVILTLLA